MTNTIPLFYQNVLAGDYQKYVGNFYHATEMFNFFADEKDLLGAGRPSLKKLTAAERKRQLALKASVMAIPQTA